MPAAHISRQRFSDLVASHDGVCRGCVGNLLVWDWAAERSIPCPECQAPATPAAADLAPELGTPVVKAAPAADRLVTLDGKRRESRRMPGLVCEMTVAAGRVRVLFTYGAQQLELTIDPSRKARVGNQADVAVTHETAGLNRMGRRQRDACNAFADRLAARLVA